MCLPSPLVCFTRHRFAATCGCALAFISAAPADEVSLANGGRLSGSVVSIGESGAIELVSMLAGEPLLLRGDQVSQVRFDPPATPAAAGEARVELVNRDFLTAALLGYTRENGASIRVEGVGELEVPPRQLRTITMGVQPAKVIYRGPDDLKQWTTDDQRSQLDKNWKLEGDRLVIDGAGQVGRMFEMPDQYIIRFTLSWRGRPNFQISFSDPLKGQSERVDRYYLQFGRAGLEIKRETSSGRRYHTVGMLNRSPDQFQDRNMDIEIRVDRRTSMIQLAIDGQPEGRFLDPFEDTPTAGGISLVSNASRGNQHEISNLVIAAWNDGTEPGLSRSESHGDPSRDTLVLHQGDHFSGALQSIREVDGGLLFLLKVNFRDEPIEILGEDVATVFFAETDAASAPSANDDLVLQLHDQGRLAVTRSSFTGSEVRATHPLLGELTLARDIISALERRPNNEAPAKP